jgi:hypothetical protein
LSAEGFIVPTLERGNDKSHSSQLDFNTPRSFWMSNGKGIAEFTHNNFFSAGTNADRYAVPNMVSQTKYTVDALVVAKC